MSKKTKDTLGVVLAGGLSLRMGRDKALLEIKQRTMLGYTAGKVAETSVCDVIVSRNTVYSCEKTLGDVRLGDVSLDDVSLDDVRLGSGTLRDIVPSKGPLSGIHAAAITYPRNHLLIVPIDLPLVDMPTLQKLIDTGVNTHSHTIYHNQALPIFVYNTQRLRDRLDAVLQGDEGYSVRRFFEAGPLEVCPLEQPDKLFNTNTPEQWQTALKKLSI